MLFRTEAFERLTDERWVESRVRAAIREIVHDAEAAFDADRLWPADEWDGWNTPLPLTSLYVGAAGVIWALAALERRGHAEPAMPLGEAAKRALEAWRRRPSLMEGVELPLQAEAGFLSGESGILLVAWQLAPSDELASDLFDRVRQNCASEVDDLMWGTPGTLLAARAMWESTGAERWAGAWRASAERVWRRRKPDGLWMQRRYGDVYRGLGPMDGAVGNVSALLGGDVLAAERRALLECETAEVLARTAIVHDGLANWPSVEGGPLAAADGQIRLQWCAGAPGIVSSAAPYLAEDLLLGGAELAWRAGPPALEKGSSLCHGTAGTGTALLKVFERTGDERWLERARRFAVHALRQVEQARAVRGRGRYSLWTGDVGVALYASDCLDSRARVPFLDTFV